MHSPVIGRELIGLEGEFGAPAAGHPLQKAQVCFVLELGKHGKCRLRMGDMAGGRVGGKGGCHILLDAIPAFH